MTPCLLIHNPVFDRLLFTGIVSTNPDLDFRNSIELRCREVWRLDCKNYNYFRCNLEVMDCALKYFTIRPHSGLIAPIIVFFQRILDPRLLSLILASLLNLAIRSPQPEKRLRGFDLNLRLSLRVSNFQIALLSSYNIYSIFSITDFSDM